MLSNSLQLHRSCSHSALDHPTRLDDDDEPENDGPRIDRSWGAPPTCGQRNTSPSRGSLGGPTNCGDRAVNSAPTCVVDGDENLSHGDDHCIDDEIVDHRGLSSLATCQSHDQASSQDEVVEEGPHHHGADQRDQSFASRVYDVFAE
jgi:hypothetical protein